MRSAVLPGVTATPSQPTDGRQEGHSAAPSRRKGGWNGHRGAWPWWQEAFGWGK